MLNSRLEDRKLTPTRTENVEGPCAAAQRETWRQVFQIVSDHPDWFTHHAIKALEEARGLAGFGPR